MKLKPTDLQRLFTEKFEHQFGILIFGQDRGMIVEYFMNISKSFGNDDENNMAVIDLTPEQIKDDASTLFSEAVAPSFFGDRKLIRIKDASDSIATTIEELIQHEPHSFLVITAENLKPTSKLRKLFEKERKLLALACYTDTQRDLTAIISETFRNEEIKAPFDAINYIAGNLGENRAQTRQELEKLILYAGPSKTLSFEDAKKCLSSGKATDLQDFVMACGEGRTDDMLFSYDKLISEGMVSIGFIRALINHFKSLFQMRILMDSGTPVKEAITKINPRVFFKTEPMFINQLRLWNKDKIFKILEQLTKTEIQCKTNTAEVAETIGARFFLTLCLHAKRK